jgi:pregnancy-associated plasma protein-A
MAGGQSQYSTPLRYRFALKKIDYTRNDGWYHAYLFGPRDVKAKRKLHRGGPRTLNLYINGGGPKGTPILGWARFPWQYHVTPKLDSVTVNVAAMRGGSARGYNLGDTVIHETGHWLGLLHTFQGGCGSKGDLVADTQAEGEPSFGCDNSRDTCPDDPGHDPVHNFMDYSLDTCMNKFTAGQVQRIDAAFAKWR